MNRETLARELYEHRNDPEEWAEEAEDIEVKPRGSSVVSFRLSPKEFDALEEAMSQTGESLSEYVRAALKLRMSPRRSGGFSSIAFGNPDHPDNIVVRVTRGEQLLGGGRSDST